MILNARVTPLQESENVNSGDGRIGETYSDGLSYQVSGEDPSEVDNFDGVALIDAKGRKKYLVARDPEGRCVCSNDLGTTNVGRGAANLEATLTAPPEGVTRVDVTVPKVKTFADVPISG